MDFLSQNHSQIFISKQWRLLAQLDASYLVVNVSSLLFTKSAVGVAITESLMDKIQRKIIYKLNSLVSYNTICSNRMIPRLKLSLQNT